MKMLIPLTCFILIGSVSAATVQFTIAVDQFDPAYTATTTNIGTVTYDESKLTGAGLESLGVNDATISFRFDDQWYTEQSDLEYPNYPEFTFWNGSFVGMVFEANLTSPGALPGSYILFDNMRVDYSFDSESEVEYSAHVEFGGTLVPEPSTTALFAVSLVLACGRRRRVN